MRLSSFFFVFFIELCVMGKYYEKNNGCVNFWGLEVCILFLGFYVKKKFCLIV